MGLSGTSAGAVRVWACSKAGKPSAPDEAIDKLNDFWEKIMHHHARDGAEHVLTAPSGRKKEIPVLGVNVPIFGLNPYGALYKAFAASLPSLGVRKQYFDLESMLAKALRISSQMG